MGRAQTTRISNMAFRQTLTGQQGKKHFCWETDNAKGLEALMKKQSKERGYPWNTSLGPIEDGQHCAAKGYQRAFTWSKYGGKNYWTSPPYDTAYFKGPGVFGYEG